jgi:hypothetical protein
MLATHNDTLASPGREAKPQLRACVISRSAADETLVCAMFELYRANYADAQYAIFTRDFAAKTHVVLVHDESGALGGFSTLQVYESAVLGTPVRVVYSGDTIIDPRLWGSSALAFEWLRFAGELKRQEPDAPLYWLLIVKGHRTYRFLSAFAYRYVPHHAQPADATQVCLRDALAAEKFGAFFDPQTALARFPTPQGRLNDALAEVPARHRRLPEVAYFLERNPGYARGEELVCLCELAASNMKPIARRAFAGG